MSAADPTLAPAVAPPHTRPAGRLVRDGSPLVPAWRILAALLAVGATSLVASLPQTDATVDGFTFLVVVLLVAARLGLVAGGVAAVAAAGAYAFLCFPPGTSLLASPDSWAALFAFLFSAALAARLVVSEQRAAAEADRRRREIEALYRLSLELFVGDETAETVVPGSERPPDPGADGFGLAERRLRGIAAERRALLAERTRLEGLRQSEAYKTALLRAVSHDLMTPMTALRVALENLSSPPGRASSELGTIRREAERLSRRLEALLSYARVERGSPGIHAEPVPPADLFRTALEALESVLEGKTVTVAVSEDCPDVRTDPPLASEILVNFLENAARLSPEGATIELSATRTEGAVALEVLDRGPGPSEAGPEGAGRAGLGLPICRGLAEALAGHVVLESRPGGGARARLVLPAAQAPLEVT